MDNLKKKFGKRKVTPETKTSLVQKIFTDVSKNYDIMNDLMSIGAHRLWKYELIELMNIQKSDKIIDVGSGTGDLLSLMLNKNIAHNIYSVDLNKEMLNLCKKKFKGRKINFSLANAEKLQFKDNYFDKYIISFCLRNVTNIKKALLEAKRILKPGGIFYCLEFSKPESYTIEKIYKSYKKNFIPWIGEKIAKNKLAYNYLSESIDLFPTQKNLLKNLNQLGFEETRYLNMFNGIVSIHIGFKI